MRFGSFCSGIGAPEVAWSGLGWEPLWFSEIAPFPSAVLAVRFPGVPNLGDMEKCDGREIRHRFGAVDVVVAGTPCQSFSVAGLRKGLDDPRGNLALVFLGLVDRLRPRWLVWENVDGVRSSGDGRDFGSFLGALGQLGYGWAYRVLDAQYFGVAQRRERVFVVGYRGDWRPPVAVLFERESMSGHSAPSRDEEENAATGVSGSIAHCLRADGFDASEDGTGRGTPIVVIPIDMRQASRGERMTNNRNPDACSGGAPGTGVGEPGDPCPSLALSHPPALCIQEAQTGVRAYATAGTLRAEAPGHQPGGSLIWRGSVIRRVTPLEEERLQGFPDGYTAVQYRGKTAADGPRYRALGNSMAVPVLRWIAERMEAVDAMASQPEAQSA